MDVDHGSSGQSTFLRQVTLAPDVPLITCQVDARLPDTSLIDIVLAIGAGRPAAIAAAVVAAAVVAAAAAVASVALTLLEQRTDNNKAIVCARVAQVNKLPVAASQF